jgi:hypothetical protein
MDNDYDVENDCWPSGWWILPAAVLGLCFWGLIIWMVRTS